MLNGSYSDLLRNWKRPDGGMVIDSSAHGCSIPLVGFSAKTDRFLNNTDLYIYDVIGGYYGIDAGMAASALGDIKTDTITVAINSPGGNAFDGIAICNLLKSHPAKIIVRVDGLAASAASIIAMAGDEIRMYDSSMLMIHNPFAFTEGNASDLRVVADALDKMTDGMINIYANKTGLSPAAVTAMMDKVTWFRGQEAVSAGFATNLIDGNPSIEGCSDIFLTFCRDAIKVMSHDRDDINDIKKLINEIRGEKV